MRRLALIVVLLAAGAAALASVAGADGVRTYKVELDNAFGLVAGSDAKVAGVKAGKITDLDINSAKRALITIEVSGPFTTFKEDATCSSEPQSLIAEFFLDCQPGSSSQEMPEGSTVPVERTTTVVQPDLANNTLREPFKRRLQIIINEFGTGLAGRPQDLNDAIRRGAPALRETRQVLDTLADQNRVIRDLNEHSDRIMGELARNSKEVARWVEASKAAAEPSAERAADIKASFNKLPDFLEELSPTMVRLGELAEDQTPVLNDLNRSSGELNRFAQLLIPFNDASRPSLTSLGDAGKIGRRALTKASDEIVELGKASEDLPFTASELAKFLKDLDDPARAFESDPRTPIDTGRSGGGYTGLENIINYVYYQSGSINQFDEVSHLLHFGLYEAETGQCHEYMTLPARNADGSVADCVSWMGPNQPGITEQVSLPPYDPSVCPQGSANHALCDPGGAEPASRRKRRRGDAVPAPAGAPLTVPGPAIPNRQQRERRAGDVLREIVPELPKPLRDLLDLPRSLTKSPLGGNRLKLRRSRATTNDLLNFLFAD